jgi:hypothetical protein
MHFGENQLSLSLIGLSPLPTAHPLHFQLKWVRSSTRSYPRFNLAMGRSLSFGSWSRDSTRPVRTRFRYGSPPQVNLATQHKLAGSFFKRHAVTTAPKDGDAPTACRHTVSGTLSLPSRGTFHLSLTVLVRYRSPGSIQAYGVVPADSHGISRAPCYLGYQLRKVRSISPTGLSPAVVRLPMRFDYRRTLSLPDRSAEQSSWSHDPEHATPAGLYAYPV